MDNQDKINPPHYKSHPSGVQCIEITRHMNFNLGNVIKYVWRAGLKTESPLEDLRKAMWYLNDEILRLQSDENRKQLEQKLSQEEYRQPIVKE